MFSRISIYSMLALSLLAVATPAPIVENGGKPSTTAKPPATTTKPPATTAKPPTTTAKPPTTTAKPPTTTAKPPTTTANPPGTTAKPPTTTVTVTAPGASGTAAAGSCNTGAIQCCQSTTTASSSSGNALLGLLGVVLSDLDVLLGVNCSPISVVGVGSGSACNAHPVCCENNSFGGLISIGCIPIEL